MQKYLMIIAIFMATGNITAQSEVDALRYSFLDFNGTARYTSMAGSMGALGGDLSALYNNPGAIGIFRSNEFSFSPGFSINSNESTHYGTNSADNKFNINLGNIGFAVAFPGREGSNVKYSQFAINYNRTQDFQNNYSIRGENSASSLSDVFANLAAGSAPEQLENNFPFTSYLAYETFLINPTGGGNEYASEFPGGSIDQIKNIESKGRVSQTDMTFGMNYNDRLFAGASIGLTGIQYSEESTYAEIINEDYSDDQLNGWTYTEELETSGSGINFNIGIIYKITNSLRVGGAWHSPTYYYELEDLWTSSLTTNFDGGESYAQDSPNGFNIYNLTTPSRYQASLAYIFGKNALINIDYEAISYSQSKLTAAADSPSNFTSANAEIKNQYTRANNLRIGGEYRLLPLSFRAGFAYYENPFNENLTVNNPERMIFTGGMRIKLSKHAYIDAAVKHSRFDNDYYLYDPALVEATELSHQNNTYRLTYGVRF